MVIVRLAGLSGGSSGRGGGSRGRGRSSRRGGSGGSSAGGNSGRLFLKSGVSAGAANTGNDDVVSVGLKSEVLESVAVPRGVGSVVLGKSDGSGVLLLFFIVVVLDDTLTNRGKVEKTVQKVRSPEGVGGAVGDVVSEHAHGGKRPTDLVGQVADDSLGSRVGAAPVTGPTLLVAVAVNVVAAEEDARLVAVGNLGEPTKGLTSGSFAKVLGVDLGVVAEAEDVVAGMADDGHCLIETLLNHATLGSVARSVDGELVNSTGVPSCGSRSSLGGVGDGDSCLARGKRSGHGDGGSKEHESRGTSSHCEIDLRDFERVLGVDVRTGVQ